MQAAESDDNDVGDRKSPLADVRSVESRASTSQSSPIVSSSTSLSLPIRPTNVVVPIGTEIEIPVEVLLVAAADQDGDFDENGGIVLRGCEGVSILPRSDGGSSQQRRRSRRSRSRPTSMTSSSDDINQSTAATLSSPHPATILLSPLNELEESTPSSSSGSSSSSSSGCCSEDDDDDDDECWEDVDGGTDDGRCSRPEVYRPTKDSFGDETFDSVMAGDGPLNDEVCQPLMSSVDVDQFFDVQSSLPMDDDRAVSTTVKCIGRVDESLVLSGSESSVPRAGVYGPNAVATATAFGSSECSTNSIGSRTVCKSTRDQHNQQQGTTGLTTRLGNLFNSAVMKAHRQLGRGTGEQQWYFCQVKGTAEDDVVDADVISCVEFNRDGDLLATGDKGGRIVIFRRDQVNKSSAPPSVGYSVYSTFQSHEPEFDYLKSLEIEEKINRIQWLRQFNQSRFLLSANDKTIKLWKLSERCKRPEGLNLKDDSGLTRTPTSITTLQVPVFVPVDMMVEASPRRVFANAHAYHINSVSINSDEETFLSADDLRINLWNTAITNQSFIIVDIKPANMEELTEVITAAEFHPSECNLFVYSSSKGALRLCDMRSQALCDKYSKFFEEPEDANNRSFFSEIISSISDVHFSRTGRYMVTRDYLTVKVWDVNMERGPVETFAVHDYLRSKLCALYENDCIFDKFECSCSYNDRHLLTGSYNNFFRIFDRDTQHDITLEASRDFTASKTALKSRRVGAGSKRKKDELSVDSLDFSKKILHAAWHPTESVVAVAATNNLYLFQGKD